MEPITTRVGLIIDGDNRFFGRSVFEEWAQLVRSPSDALLISLGVNELTDVAREGVRLIALCLASPDARVWPLKLTRLLSSWGDPVAGYFGGQLVTAGKVMGPGAGTSAALCLQWLLHQVGEGASQEEVSSAVARWKAENPGPIGGFGVPFREHDERRVALLRFVGDGPISKGRHWRLHHQLVEAMAPVRPNCAISFSAILLDIGVAPERCGLAFSVLMPHVFLGHALEGSEDGARLNDWPASHVEYRGTARRQLGDGARAQVHDALRRAEP